MKSAKWFVAITLALSACSTGYVRKDGTVMWKTIDEGNWTQFHPIHGGVDLPSFVKLSDDFAKDKNHVYFRTWRSDADPASFVYLGDYYGKDSARVYFQVIPLAGVDVASFQIIKGTGKARDKNYCFSYGRQMDCNGVADRTIHDTVPGL